MARSRQSLVSVRRQRVLLLALLVAGAAAVVLAARAGDLQFFSSARASCTVVGEPTVVTDKDDYLPAETAQIDGCGFESYEGQSLTIRFTRPDSVTSTDTVTIASGKFTYYYLLDGIFGTYLVEVLDGGSNTIAATTFTDHTGGTVLIRDSSDAFGANSYTTDSLGVTLDISWSGTPDVTQARFTNDVTPETACPAFVSEPWLPITEIGITNTGTFPWTLLGVTSTGLHKVCSQTAHGPLGSPADMISHEDIIFFRKPNPVLTQTCGIDIVVIMDNSGSIDSSELATMKTAVNGFVTALMPETPTEMALVTFNTSATVAQAFTATEATMTAAVNGVPLSGGFTNWDDGLANGRALLPNRLSKADLILIASDGNPNRRGGHTALGHSAVVSAVSETNAMAWATAEANQAKTDGDRIVGIGIGGDVDVNNLIAVSGTSVHPPDPISTTVDVITSDFSSLAADLAAYVAEICPGNIFVHKTIDADGNLGTTGDQTPGVGWTFSCNAGADTCTPSSDVTDVNGDIPGSGPGDGFEIGLGGDETASVSITETVMAGFGFMSAGCVTNNVSNGTPGTNQVTGITVTPGDIVNCTFYNTPASYITVNKACVPPAAPGLFNLRIDGTTYAANAPCGGSTGQVLVTPGTHTVSETAGTGTSLSDYDTVIGGDCAANGSITIAGGQNKTCTITNTLKPKLTVNKVCAPPADPGLFNLRIDGITYGADKPCGGTTGPVVLSVGAHTVSETAGTGTNLSNYETPIISGDCAGNGGITLAAGENKTCTITNTRKPTLTVNKACDPPGDPGLFNLRIDGVTHASNAACGGTTGPITVSVGPHTVSETAGTGTSLSDYAITIGLPCAANGTITLAAGENKTCTITNKRLGTLVINKVASPQGPQDFSFVCTTLGGFTLDDDGANGNPLDSSKTFNGVVPGDYDCTETQVAGWLISISCNDPDGESSTTPPTAHADVDGGETVECTFTNTFVPGQSQTVGGIAGLIDGDDSGAGRSAAAGTGAGDGLPFAAAALSAGAAIIWLALRRRAT